MLLKNKDKKLYGDHQAPDCESTYIESRNFSGSNVESQSEGRVWGYEK